MKTPGTIPKAVGERYGGTHTGCGLCQTRVPCEAGIPPGKKNPAGNTARKKQGDKE
jgi:hypothetical protein